MGAGPRLLCQGENRAAREASRLGRPCVHLVGACGLPTPGPCTLSAAWPLQGCRQTSRGTLPTGLRASAQLETPCFSIREWRSVSPGEAVLAVRPGRGRGRGGEVAGLVGWIEQRDGGVKR